jgi:phosphatidylglycerophosphate synthase
VLILFLLLEKHRDIMYGVITAAIVAPLIAMGVLWLVRRRFWPGALIMSLLSLPLLYLHTLNNLPLTVDILMIVVVALTWLSGIDYILVGMRELRGRGDFGRSDVVRIVGALLLPCAIFAALTKTAMPAWALVTILSVELSVGGLDNLLSHHRVAASALSWSLRVLGTSALLLLGLLLDAGQQQLLLVLATAAAVISVVGVAREFWRGRDYYVDQRLRNRSLGTPATS